MFNITTYSDSQPSSQSRQVTVWVPCPPSSLPSYSNETIKRSTTRHPDCRQLLTDRTEHSYQPNRSNLITFHLGNDKNTPTSAVKQSGVELNLYQYFIYILCCGVITIVRGGDPAIGILEPGRGWGERSVSWYHVLSRWKSHLTSMRLRHKTRWNYLFMTCKLSAITTVLQHCCTLK